MSEQDSVSTAMQAAEQQRLAYVRKQRLYLANSVVSAIITLGAYTAWEVELLSLFPAVVIGIVGVAFSVINNYRYRGSEESVQNSIKKGLVNTVISSLGHKIEYDPERSISTRPFSNLGWINRFGTFINGQDLLKSRYGQTAFVSSMVYTQKSSGETTEPSLLLIADSNKHFKGRTVIITKLWQGKLGGWASAQVQGLKHMRLQSVHLEDITFEAQFDVYASDQVEARYLITPNIMQRLVELQRATQRDFRVAFDNGRVYVQVANMGGFDLSLSHKIYPNHTFRNIRYRWDLICKMIDALGLNDRVWTKE